MRLIPGLPLAAAWTPIAVFFMSSSRRCLYAGGGPRLTRPGSAADREPIGFPAVDVVLVPRST